MTEGTGLTATDRIRAVYVSDHARLWRSLLAFGGSVDVADEASAEAFAQALRRGDELRDPAAWIWRSAFAIARGELQRRRRDIPSVSPEREPTITVADAELTAVLHALSGLSEGDRELVVLCHVGGWKPGELAGVLGGSAGAIRVRLHRATARARRLLEPNDGDSSERNDR